MYRIAITGNDRQDGHIEEIAGLLVMLRELCCAVTIESSFADYLIGHGLDLGRFMRSSELPSDTRLVLSLGGDGTFLHAAQWVGELEVPIAGVNTGHLGYLTSYSLNEPEELRAALEGKFEITSRMTLEVSTRYLTEGFTPFALNEISVSKGDTTSMVEIHVLVDGHYLGDYKADGLVVSTPTGSTAYNLSCGGPIVQPTMGCFVISPIAPHSLTLRPLVVSAASEIVLEVWSRGAECHVGVDGRTFTVPADGTRIRVRRSHRLVNVAHPRGTYFSDVLRKKLGWGK